MRILLTGASGFLGIHTAEELRRRGHSVLAMVQKSSRIDPLQKLGVDFVTSSLPDCEGLEAVLDTCDAVVHLAGIIKALSPKQFYRVNELGTKNLVQKVLASPSGPRLFIHISTIAVHNPSEGLNFCLPPQQCHSLSHYGESKRRGELVLKGLGDKVHRIVLRPPVLYGPWDTQFLPLVKSISKGFAPLYRRGNNLLSLCYISDVARAIGDILDRPPPSGEIFCLDDGSAYSWRDLSLGIAAALGRKAVLIPVPHALFFLAAGVNEACAKMIRKPTIFTLNKVLEIKQKFWVCGSQRLSDDLDWRPQVALAEGFQKTLKFYRDAAWLKG